MQLAYHALADLLPLMDGKAFEEFKADIAVNGVQHPIVLHEGLIVDGRNRYRACVDLGKTPPTCEWNGNGSLLDYITSVNVHRRHLTSSQLATYAVEALPFAEVEAKERKRSGGVKSGATRRGEDTAKMPDVQDHSGEAREQVARAFNTSARYVSDAKVLKREAPEIFEKVKRGELQMHKAVEERRKSLPQTKPAKLVQETKSEKHIDDLALKLCESIDELSAKWNHGKAAFRSAWERASIYLSGLKFK